MPPTGSFSGSQFGSGRSSGAPMQRITPQPVGGPAPGSLVPGAPQAPQMKPQTPQFRPAMPQQGYQQQGYQQQGYPQAHRKAIGRPQTQGIQVPQQGPRFTSGQAGVAPQQKHQAAGYSQQRPTYNPAPLGKKKRSREEIEAINNQALRTIYNNSQQSRGQQAPVYNGIPTNQAGGGLQQNPQGQWGMQSIAGGAPQAPGGGVPVPGDFAPGYRNPATNIPNAPYGADVIRLPSGEHKTTSGAKALEQLASTAARQQQLLGDPELSARLGIDPSRFSPLTRQEIGLGQVGEYARQERLAEGDLQRGTGILGDSRQTIGTDPGSMLAMQLAMSRAQNGGQFNDQYLDQQRGVIRNRGGVAAQTAERSLAEDMARRGVQGPLAGLYSSQLQQQNALGVQGQLGDFEQNAAQAREEADRAALGQLEGISARQEQERLGIDQSLANAYLQNERTPLDFSPLAVELRKKKNIVGGMAKNTSTTGRG